MYNYHRVGISSEGIVVILCVCMLAKSQTLVAAAAARNTETQGSQDLFFFLEKVVSSQLAVLLLSCEAAKAGKFGRRELNVYLFGA